MRLSKVGETELLLKISPCVARWEYLGYGMERARLLSSLAKFPGCLRATLCFLSGYCRYETTSELNREGP